MSAELAAIVAAVLLAALALLQVALIAGAPLGQLVWGGRHRVLPNRLRWAGAVSVVLYAVVAWILLDGAGLLRIGDIRFAGVVVWLVAAYALFSAALDAASRSKLERYVMTPVSGLVAVAAVVVALA